MHPVEGGGGSYQEEAESVIAVIIHCFLFPGGAQGQAGWDPGQPDPVGAPSPWQVVGAGWASMSPTTKALL